MNTLSLEQKAFRYDLLEGAVILKIQDLLNDLSYDRQFDSEAETDQRAIEESLEYLENFFDEEPYTLAYYLIELIVFETFNFSPSVYNPFFQKNPIKTNNDILSFSKSMNDERTGSEEQNQNLSRQKSSENVQDQSITTSPSGKSFFYTNKKKKDNSFPC